MSRRCEACPRGACLTTTKTKVVVDGAFPHGGSLSFDRLILILSSPSQSHATPAPCIAGPASGPRPSQLSQHTRHTRSVDRHTFSRNRLPVAGPASGPRPSQLSRDAHTHHAAPCLHDSKHLPHSPRTTKPRTPRSQFTAHWRNTRLCSRLEHATEPRGASAPVAGC